MPQAERKLLRSRRFDELLLNAADWYADEAGEDIALRFVDAVENAVGAATRHPAIGSSYPAEAAGVTGLRSWAVAEFPYLLYYTYDEYTVTLWVILHGRRDLPQALIERDP